jgi:hypothetical protein
MSLSTRGLQYRRRAVVSGVIAVLTAAALQLAALPIWFTLTAVGIFIAGYCGIDALMGSELTSPYNTPYRTWVQRVARTLLKTSSFLLLLLLLGLLSIATILGLDLLLSP